MRIFEWISGFDDQGRQFDLHGNLVDWWQDDTEAQFATKAQCMVEQVDLWTFSRVFAFTTWRMVEQNLKISTVFKLRRFRFKPKGKNYKHLNCVRIITNINQMNYPFSWTVPTPKVKISPIMVVWKKPMPLIAISSRETGPNYYCPDWITHRNSFFGFQVLRHGVP